MTYFYRHSWPLRGFRFHVRVHLRDWGLRVGWGVWDFGYAYQWQLQVLCLHLMLSRKLRPEFPSEAVMLDRWYARLGKKAVALYKESHP